MLGEIGDFVIVTALVKTGIGKEICDDSVFNGENIISQDAVIVIEKIESSWFAVADGVGGNAGGHEASNYLLDYIQCNYEKTDDEAALELLLKDANISLIDNAQKIARKEQMATTFTGVFFCNEDLKIAHSGNTRLYALQGNYLKQLTSDHTTYQWLIRQGNYEAAEMCNKSEIISCFGGGDNDLLKMLSVETILMESIPNTLIMTSDGIHDYVDIDTFEEILCEPIPIKERVIKLWKKAQELGSNDDCSVLIMER